MHHGLTLLSFLQKTTKQTKEQIWMAYQIHCFLILESLAIKFNDVNLIS